MSEFPQSKRALVGRKTFESKSPACEGTQPCVASAPCGNDAYLASTAAGLRSWRSGARVALEGLPHPRASCHRNQVCWDPRPTSGALSQSDGDHAQRRNATVSARQQTGSSRRPSLRGEASQHLDDLAQMRS
eukprot:CAMPEP_0197701756 /NCGR_PEP_ID=MMETSP1338-20131121/123667_1 /TAXON_ID=43686 ORGANISM="Pelagodinium beii, Strain RCC1491" /NCGR_SAMPLE_ID=MMETSP1338 /ASSEMBLY_ACC=CAM_ASM_000754 /LENGTH=131 /DNA_ID=CAMNT_0043285497 /DNA_START=37 /DNA_END=432 /DNA_ORIENTATION=-